jgi:hypothetical protein
MSAQPARIAVRKNSFGWQPREKENSLTDCEPQPPIQVGDPVQIFLNAQTFGQEGWFNGTVVRIDPYSAHRSFHWVALDAESQAILGSGIGLVSVFNPKNIRKRE